MSRKALSWLFATFLLSFSAFAAAAPASAPTEIKIGALYASSGPFAAISMPAHMGLKLWVDDENAKGGVLVKPFGKRVPIKLVSYDDESNTATAATLYNQLITQDKVNILVADVGSVLTSMAVPIAREHKIMLFDLSGTGESFFTPDNPYIALVGMPASTVWPKSVAEFLTQEGPKLGIKRIALIYTTNEFAGTQISAMRKAIKDSHAPIEIVYDKGVPTNTSNYTVLLNSVRAAQPDAVIQVGYPGNDTAFLRNLHDSGVHLKWLFAVFPGLETEHMLKTVGVDALKYVYTYAPPSQVEYKVTSGMTLTEFREAWKKAYPSDKVSFGVNSVVGYAAGVVIQNALATTKSLDQLDLHDAVFGLSGKLKTIDGAFELDKDGAQLGETMPLSQLVPDGKGGLKFSTVYPSDVANGKPVYPAPSN